MKRILMVLLFSLISLIGFSQGVGEVIDDGQGNKYVVSIAWTLNNDVQGNPVLGEGEEVYGTPSFYWQVIRSLETDDFGYYNYFMFFYSNASYPGYVDADTVEYQPYDLVLENLVVKENDRQVYSNSFYFIDRSGDSVVFWRSIVPDGATLEFSYDNSSVKKHIEYKTQQYKNGGY